MRILKTPVFIALSSILIACTTDVEEELYPCLNPQDLSYQIDIQPIISNDCYACHSEVNAFAISGIVLEGYENLIKKVDDGKLLCAIKHENCALPMPRGQDQLDECLINKIENWINQGALNN